MSDKREIGMYVFVLIAIVLLSCLLISWSQVKEYRQTNERQNAENILYLQLNKNLTAQVSMMREYGFNDTYSSCEAFKAIINEYDSYPHTVLSYNVREFQEYLNSYNCYDLAIETWSYR